MHAFLHDKSVQLYGILSTPVNTGAEQIAIGGGCLQQVKKLTSQYIGTFASAYIKGYALN